MAVQFKQPSPGGSYPPPQLGKERSQYVNHNKKKLYNNIKNYKTPGIGVIPSELLKHGGETLQKELHLLLLAISATVKIPS